MGLLQSIFITSAAASVVAQSVAQSIPQDSSSQNDPLTTNQIINYVGTLAFFASSVIFLGGTLISCVTTFKTWRREDRLLALQQREIALREREIRVRELELERPNRDVALTIEDNNPRLRQREQDRSLLTVQQQSIRNRNESSPSYIEPARPSETPEPYIEPARPSETPEPYIEVTAGNQNTPNVERYEMVPAPVVVAEPIENHYAAIDDDDRPNRASVVNIYLEPEDAYIDHLPPAATKARPPAPLPRAPRTDEEIAEIRLTRQRNPDSVSSDVFRTSGGASTSQL